MFKRWFLFLALVACLFGQAVSDADRQRFEQIRAKHESGQPITDEERQFAQSVMARLSQANHAAENQAYAKAHPPRESTGLIPLQRVGACAFAAACSQPISDRQERPDCQREKAREPNGAKQSKTAQPALAPCQ